MSYYFTFLASSVDDGFENMTPNTKQSDVLFLVLQLNSFVFIIFIRDFCSCGCFAIRFGS